MDELEAGYEALAASWDAEDEAVRASRKNDRARRRHYTVHVAAIKPSHTLYPAPDMHVYLECERCPEALTDASPCKIVPGFVDWVTIPVAQLDVWIEKHESEAHR